MNDTHALHTNVITVQVLCNISIISSLYVVLGEILSLLLQRGNLKDYQNDCCYYILRRVVGKLVLCELLTPFVFHKNCVNESWAPDKFRSFRINILQRRCYHSFSVGIDDKAKKEEEAKV